MTDRERRIETTAQLLHAARHRAGTGHVCDRCRAEALRLVWRAR